MIPTDLTPSMMQDAERARMGAKYISPFFMNLPDPVLPEIGVVRVGWRPGYRLDPERPSSDLIDLFTMIFKGKKH